MAFCDSLHKQIMFLPTGLGTALFVWAALNVGSPMDIVAILLLLYVTVPPFQYSYKSLFPIEPSRLREAKLVPSILFFVAQVLFWVVLFVVASHWGAKNGA